MRAEEMAMDTTQDWRSSVEVDDDTFQQSLARLSQQIAARRSAVLLPAPLPPLRREWKAWPFLLLIAVAGAAAAGYHYAAFVDGDLLLTRPGLAEASIAPPAPVLAAVAVAAAPAATVPAPAPSITTQEPVPAAERAAPTPIEIASPASETPPGPAIPPEPENALSRAEVLEVQKRLVALGISPGPLDGIVGPLTAGGVQQYEQLRGGPVSGKVDRRLLQLLKQDAVPTAISLEAQAR
jgi:hypothetical protein